MEPYTVEEISEDETHYLPVDQEHRTDGPCVCDPQVRIGHVSILVIHVPLDMA